jgi:hypothetical protein
LTDTDSICGVTPSDGAAESQNPPELVVRAIVKGTITPLLETWTDCAAGAAPPDAALKIRNALSRTNSASTYKYTPTTAGLPMDGTVSTVTTAE